MDPGLKSGDPMVKSKNGEKGQKKPLGLAGIIAISVLLSFMCGLVALYGVELVNPEVYRFQYTVTIETDSPDGYMAYLPYPRGDDGLAPRYIVVEEGNATVDLVNTKFGKALRIVANPVVRGDTSAKIVLDYYSKDDQDFDVSSPKFEGITLINGTLTKDCDIQVVSYLAFFTSSSNTTWKISLEYSTSDSYLDETTTHEGGFSATSVSNGWNSILGNYKYHNAKKC